MREDIPPHLSAFAVVLHLPYWFLFPKLFCMEWQGLTVQASPQGIWILYACYSEFQCAARMTHMTPVCQFCRMPQSIVQA